jgi:hypothetical protein
MKFCNRCKTIKPISGFYKNRGMRDGLTSMCIQCQKRYVNARRIGIDAYLLKLLGCCRQRAAKKHIPFTLTIDDLSVLWQSQGGRCTLTGLAMTHRHSSATHREFYTNASVDRIKGDAGYLPSNIRLVCNWANRARSGLTDGDFAYLCGLTKNYNPCSTSLTVSSLPDAPEYVSHCCQAHQERGERMKHDLTAEQRERLRQMGERGRQTRWGPIAG